MEMHQTGEKQLKVAKSVCAEGDGGKMGTKAMIVRPALMQACVPSRTLARRNELLGKNEC